MDTIASQITSLSIVCSTVHSGAGQSKHQSSASLVFVRGIRRGPGNSPHKEPVTRKMFPFDDVIMTGTQYTRTRNKLLINCGCVWLIIHINILWIYINKQLSWHTRLKVHLNKLMCWYMCFKVHIKHRYETVDRYTNHWTNASEHRSNHYDVIKWKHFPRNWPFVRGIHRSPVNSPHKGQWRGALMFTLIYARINGWVNNR